MATSQAVIDKWLGTLAWSRRRGRSMSCAGRGILLLERAGVQASTLSAIFLSGGMGLRLQNDLAAKQAVAFDHPTSCRHSIECSPGPGHPGGRPAGGPRSLCVRLQDRVAAWLPVMARLRSWDA